VGCRQCHGAFYCNYGELRHAGVALLCPFCHERFLPDDAASIDERWGDTEAAPA
jgi:hypothetical protein